MNILMVADSKLPVPPEKYGGAERIMAHIADGCAEAGHSVTLMGHRSSHIDGRVIAYGWAGQNPKLKRGLIKLIFFTLFERELMRRPDVIIANCRIDYLLRLKGRPFPLLYRFDNPITADQEAVLRDLKLAKMRIVALTRSHAAPLKNTNDLSIIDNCVDVERLTFSPDYAEGYLAFLGRLTRNKGVDIAIRAARRTGLPLRIAGNVSDEDGGREFFETEVRPQLDDQIRWIGEITDAEKSAFLGNARALLVPIQWEEPFGIVVPEALACGTPVIASPRGSMPELIRQGENGLLATTDDEFSQAIAQIPALSRAACRADAKKRFSRKVVVDQYLEAIKELLLQ